MDASWPVYAAPSGNPDPSELYEQDLDDENWPDECCPCCGQVFANEDDE